MKKNEMLEKKQFNLLIYNTLSYVNFKLRRKKPT